MSRPTWDEVWLDVATTVGRRSRCVRAQVGAVIVTADNRVDSASYNGPIAGLQLVGDCGGWCPRGMGLDPSPIASEMCHAIHAEANALTRANHAQIQGGTIYVSRSMCVNCAKNVCNSGLTRVVHRVLPEDSHRDPDGVEALIRSAGLTVQRHS